MKFQFADLADFLAMPGPGGSDHGPYVWFCYGITLVCLLYLVLAPIWQQKSLTRELQRQRKLQQRDLRHGQSAQASDT